MDTRTKRIAIGTLVAGAMGYIAGILTAPKSGKETRGVISHARTSAITEAEKQLKKMHTELNYLVHEAEDTAKQATAKARHLGRDHTSQDGRQVVDDVISQASGARQKTREILSAIHHGDADDKDLRTAVAEAGKAIHSLRKYLKK